MRIINRTRNTVLADKAVIANNFLSRLVGLLNRSNLNSGEALILSPSNAIHSFFMRFTFDAILLNKDNQVVATISCFKPFRASRIYFGAVTTLELPSGAIQASKTQIQDKIGFEA